MIPFRKLRLLVLALVLLVDFLLLLRHSLQFAPNSSAISASMDASMPAPSLLSRYANRTHDAHHHNPLSAPRMDTLPPWITNYFAWHRSMRHQFSDQQLLRNKTAPKILVQNCLHSKRYICGGLHDRLGRLSSALYVANQTRRVLLIKWHDPLPLETFLQPHTVNWTVPYNNVRFSRDTIVQRNSYYQPSGGNTSLMDWVRVPIKISQRVLVFGRAGISTALLESELQAAGETDMLDDTASFGQIWHAFFQPSTQLQDRLDATRKALGLTVKDSYLATHCRVRHPGRFQGHVEGRNGSTADRTGLLFHGNNKEMAVRAAVHALNCTESLRTSDAIHDEPVYFYSDSEDYISRVAQKTAMRRDTETALDRQAAEMLSRTRVISQETSNLTVAHLDRQFGLPAEAYLATFFDLYMAVTARCVVFGVGNFGYLASKISGTSCKLLHEEPYSKRKARMWNQQTGGALMCMI